MEMSPFSYYLTYGKGTERPFTGDLYFTKEVGDYHCLVCNNKLFAGMASFWGCLPDSISIKDDVAETKVKCLTHNIIDFELKKGGDDMSPKEKAENSELYSQEKQRVECKQCKSHLGLAFKDGPPPTFLRMSINSGAITFNAMPFNVNPLVIKKKKMQKKFRIKKQMQSNYMQYKEDFVYQKQITN